MIMIMIISTTTIITINDNDNNKLFHFPAGVETVHCNPTYRGDSHHKFMGYGQPAYKFSYIPLVSFSPKVTNKSMEQL